MSSFRTGERRDASKYAYPMSSGASPNYVPRDLQAQRIPAMNPVAKTSLLGGGGDFIIKFYYDNDWFPEEVVKASSFPSGEREAVEHAKQVRKQKTANIIGVEVINPITGKIISAEGQNTRSVGAKVDIESEEEGEF